MSPRQAEMSIGMNILGHGGHAAGWRVGEVEPTAIWDVGYYQNIARICEAGALDAIFLADGPALQGDVGEQPAGRLEPTVLVTAMAAVTERIGMIATCSTTYNDPFNLARRFASVDHISGGRVAWNAVTTATPTAAANFGLTGAPVHTDRYARADEFVELVIKLWDSWEDDAIIGDRGNGIYADRARVHAVDHEGEHFSVKGPLNVARSPQGRPVLVQAGSSEGGKQLAARFADAVFTTQTTLPDGQAFYAEIKARAAAQGRDPATIRIMPGISTVIGGTEAEAKARQRELDELLGWERPLATLSGQTGIPVEALVLDERFPVHLIGDAGHLEQGSHGFFDAAINLALREQLTVRELLGRIRSGHRLVVGAPEQIAETMEEWFREGAADGFNIMPDYFPSGAEVFVDHVVPELRRRGVFRTEYAGTTLRDHLGLPWPDNQYAAGPGAAAAA
jgi:FMN-dependent oxidoreductase (nitrilotriacetate monooxygenase family)